MDRSEDGLVFFEDFVSWYMIYTAGIYRAYQEKKTHLLLRHETIQRQRTVVQLVKRPSSSADALTSECSPFKEIGS